MKISKILALVAVIFLTSNCATHISKPKSSNVSSKVKLGDFKSVEMKYVAANEKVLESSSNKRAVDKINTELSKNLREIFGNFNNLPSDKNFANSKVRTLQIAPYIEDMKFVSGAMRFWFGAMAGSSAVHMKVSFIDSSTGKIVAEPEFYRSANVFSGPWGIADNLMLNAVARDVSNYASSNK